MILAIDTSLGTAVAVVESDGAVRAERESLDARGHAEVIGDLIAGALADAQVAASEIAYVAVGMGPGPFTGLRVGIAAARAFALGARDGRGVPIVPVVSHDAAALDVLLADAITGEQSEAFAVVTDARRRELASSTYTGLDDDGLPLRTAGPTLVPKDALDAVLGDLARRDVARIPASLLGVVAARAVAAGRAVAPDEAIYLRAPDVTVPTGPKRVGA